MSSGTSWRDRLRRNDRSRSCDNKRIPLTPSPSPARGEGGRMATREPLAQQSAARESFPLSPRGRGAGGEGACRNRALPSASIPAARQRAGFTLVDLIGVACALALLAAIFIYAVQQSRIRARSLGCRDKLRRIGIALSQYTDIHRTLPIVTFSGSDYRLAQSPLALLVPLLPQDDARSSASAGAEASYDSTQPWFRQRAGVAAATVPTFRCPATHHLDPCREANRPADQEMPQA